MTGIRQTVFMVEDDEAVRQSLELLMESVGLQVETYPSATEFLSAFSPGRSGCILLDIRMPGISGLELQKKLEEMRANLPIIFLTGHADIALAVRAMQAGAFHFFEKPANEQELLERIRQALERDARDREQTNQLEAIRDRLSQLTPRELEVMDLVVDGRANKVIAMNLGISERTVEIHRARVMEKMEAPSLAELVRMVLQSRS